MYQTESSGGIGGVTSGPVFLTSGPHSFVTEQFIRAIKLYTRVRGISGRPCRSLAERIAAFSLVYREYRARGICADNRSGIHLHAHALSSNSSTVVLEKQGHLIGTATVIEDSSAGLPLDRVFQPQLSVLRSAGRRVAEISLLALDHREFKPRAYSLRSLSKISRVMVLFKAVLDHCIRLGVNDLVIVCHPRHASLYRYLRFETLGCTDRYPGPDGPAICLRFSMDVLDGYRPVTPLERFMLAPSWQGTEQVQCHRFTTTEALAMARVLVGGRKADSGREVSPGGR